MIFFCHRRTCLCSPGPCRQKKHINKFENTVVFHVVIFILGPTVPQQVAYPFLMQVWPQGTEELADADTKYY